MGKFGQETWSPNRSGNRNSRTKDGSHVSVWGRCRDVEPFSVLGTQEDDERGLVDCGGLGSVHAEFELPTTLCSREAQLKEDGDRKISYRK